MRLGFGFGLDNQKGAKFGRPPFKSDLLQWTKGQLETYNDIVYLLDKIGTTGVTDGREEVGGAYLQGNGTRSLLFTGYPNESLTYYDHVTKTVENGTTDASGIWLVPTNGAEYVVLDGNTFNFEEGNNDNVCIGSDGVLAYIQNATGNDRATDYSIDSDFDANGGSVSNSAVVQLYYDQPLTQPIPDGVNIPIRADGKLQAYDSNGLATPQWVGKLRRDMRVVDGVVDNGVDYGKWADLSFGNVEFSENGIKIFEDVVSERANLNLSYLKTNFQYTVVVTPIDGNTDNRRIFLGRSNNTPNSAFAGNNALIQMDNGEKRILVTTVADLTGKVFDFTIFGETVGQYEEFKVYVYEGDYTTGDLPTTGELALDNSLIQHTLGLAKYQDGLVTEFYDNTDPTLPVPKVVPINELAFIDNSPSDIRLFVQELWAEHLWYKTAKTGSDLEKVEKYMGF